MEIDDYQKESSKTLRVDSSELDKLLYSTLGLAGESGEVANKVKKIIRDDGSQLSNKKKQEIASELGDVLWYLARVAELNGYKLSEIAQMNLDKLFSRMDRGKLGGDGDNR